MKKTVLDKYYSVYKNDGIIASGTAYECAEELNITAEYVYWMSTPTGKRRLATRNDIDNAQTAVLIE